MTRKPATELRRGWTTGACATAATKAALQRLWGGTFPADVQIVLPRGETPVFALAHTVAGAGWAEVGITKDAGDDPDVTHRAEIRCKIAWTETPGVEFRAGLGVGTVTKPGLPIPPGEPAINPVPRRMIRETLHEVLAVAGRSDCGVSAEISVPGGQVLWLPPQQELRLPSSAQ